MPLVGALQRTHDRAAVRFHIASRPFDCLYARFFIEAENDRVQRWVQIETYDVGRLYGELPVRAYTPTAESLQVDAFPAQHTPYCVYASAQFFGQRWPVPVRHAARRRLFDLRQQAITKLYSVGDRLAGSRLVYQSPQPFAEKPLS